ncbi:MAG: hypothetical protein RL026_59 [Pseudomonadota bacterium]|jgi:uncharacterized membrane protein YedE/YeeE
MDQRKPASDWNAYLAGVLLGLVLLATFVLTGHGLGASGFTTALAAETARAVAPAATEGNAYLGPMVAEGAHPLDSWITWQVLGVAVGALLSAFLGGRFRWRLEGPTRMTPVPRAVVAVLGGLAAGFGARISAGCTSGLGLSGAATLAVAGFVFLAGFFIVGLAAGMLTKRYWQ